MIELIKQPWPWYAAGIVIGLLPAALLLIGNKAFGISSSLRHMCAAVLPANVKFFRYDWRKESWNLLFAGGMVTGAFIASMWLADPGQMIVAESTKSYLVAHGVTSFTGYMPADVFGWQHLFTLRGVIMIIGGGFLVGFGSRYAGGCTSGHSIMGISNLQVPSLIATASFFVGGLVMVWFILPLILTL